MKRIINGSTYDSESAVLVCKIWEGNRGDFSHLDCALYQTPRSKRFFLAGYGGPMTIFSERFSDGSIGSAEKIIPLTEQDALAYARTYASDDAIGKFFEVEEA